MAKPLVIPLSFKTTSVKEMELYKILYALDDRGDEIKQVLGELYAPEYYKRGYDKKNENNDMSSSTSNIDLLNY